MSRILQWIEAWWKENHEENNFVHDTLSELHEELCIFDLENDFWTQRGMRGVSIYRGEKFPLYLYGKTTCLCMVTLEKKLGQWFLVVEYVYCVNTRQDYPVSYIDTVVADIRAHYNV